MSESNRRLIEAHENIERELPARFRNGIECPTHEAVIYDVAWFKARGGETPDALQSLEEHLEVCDSCRWKFRIAADVAQRWDAVIEAGEVGPFDDEACHDFGDRELANPTVHEQIVTRMAERRHELAEPVFLQKLGSCAELFCCHVADVLVLMVKALDGVADAEAMPSKFCIFQADRMPEKTAAHSGADLNPNRFERNDWRSMECAPETGITRVNRYWNTFGVTFCWDGEGREETICFSTDEWDNLDVTVARYPEARDELEELLMRVKKGIATSHEWHNGTSSVAATRDRNTSIIENDTPEQRTTNAAVFDILGQPTGKTVRVRCIQALRSDDDGRVEAHVRLEDWSSAESVRVEFLTGGQILGTAEVDANGDAFFTRRFSPKLTDDELQHFGIRVVQHDADRNKSLGPEFNKRKHVLVDVSIDGWRSPGCFMSESISSTFSASQLQTLNIVSYSTCSMNKRSTVFDIDENKLNSFAAASIAVWLENKGSHLLVDDIANNQQSSTPVMPLVRFTLRPSRQPPESPPIGTAA